MNGKKELKTNNMEPQMAGRCRQSNLFCHEISFTPQKSQDNSFSHKISYSLPIILRQAHYLGTAQTAGSYRGRA